MCKIPECANKSTTTWADVSLCAQHREIIEVETAKFYSSLDRRPEPLQRPLYYQIDLLIPWSKRNLKLKRGERI